MNPWKYYMSPRNKMDSKCMIAFHYQCMRTFPSAKDPSLRWYHTRSPFLKDGPLSRWGM